MITAQLIIESYTNPYGLFVTKNSFLLALTSRSKNGRRVSFFSI